MDRAAHASRGRIPRCTRAWPPAWTGCEVVRRVSANPFRRQWEECEEAVLAAVRRVGQSGWYILGSEVQSFERSLATRQERAHAIGCASGLDAIEIGLRALGLEPGDRVLTTPLSAFATSLAILRAGGVPVFCDVDAAGLLDLERAAACLSENPDIKHLVSVNLYGHAIDRENLSEIKQRFGLSLVEDCAQSIGATSHGRPAGNIGEITTFSFYPTKNLGALGDGGAIVVDDKGLSDACRRLRNYGQSSKYEHTTLGLNSRLDELHASVLHHAFLPRLEDWTRRRRAIAMRYQAGLASQPDLALVPKPHSSESAWHLFPVRVSGGKRDACLSYLRENGVEANVHYPGLIPDQPAIADDPRIVRFDPLERAYALAREELSLPIHPLLEDDEIDHVIDLLTAWGT
jgi:dTDP-4-amino-4,6-dideoxygalactose transaminase